MTPEAAGQVIIVVASKFLNLYETKANAEWDDPATAGHDAAADELKKLMLATGWQSGWAWCAAFSEAVWRKAYTSMGAPAPLLASIAAKLTPSVMNSYENWKTQVTYDPLPGSIFFMQKGSDWQGHAGIVVKAAEGRMSTIEGNTSPDPKAVSDLSPDKDREGDGVFLRTTRRVDFTPQKKGLWLRGFLNPITF